MVQDHDDTNDLLQNTFMKAWQSLDAFRGEAKLSTWLYKIAINESITHLDKLKRRQSVSLDDEELSLASVIEADTHFDGDELQEKLRLAIASLPEKQRLVFNMKYFDDMKYDDMSEILGTSVGALKASYHLAVKKFNNFFQVRIKPLIITKVKAINTSDMTEEKDILDKINHRDGLTVPEGYFAEFAKRMAESLPENELEASAKESTIKAPRTLWHRVRPYVYMAAMFAGVWCMLKMFTLVSGGTSSFEHSPILADALGNDSFVNEYILNDVSQWDVIDDMMEEGVDFEMFADSIPADTLFEIEQQ